MLITSTRFRCFITAFVIANLILFTGQFAKAQWEEAPEPGVTVNFGGSSNSKAQAFTGQALYAGSKGWVGLQGTQVSTDGEILSQDINGRAQLDIGYLQVFAEASRDTEAELTTATGGYFRYIATYKELDFIIGVGTFVEREALRKELGLDETAPTNLPYWLWSIGTDYQFQNIGLHGQVIATPESRFKHWKGTAHFGVDIDLPQGVTLTFQNVNDFSNADGVTTIETENSIIASINF